MTLTAWNDIRKPVARTIALSLGVMLALLAAAQPSYAIREMAGRYLKFSRYVVDWGSSGQLEKSSYADFDPVGGYARIRPRPQSIPEGGEMELFWTPDQWPKLITEGEAFAVTVRGRISSRPSMGTAMGINASADKQFFLCGTPSGRPYWHIIQFAGRYSDGNLVEGSQEMVLTLKDLSKVDPNVKETAIGIWFEPYGPTVTYYYDVVRNVGDAPPTVNTPPLIPGGGDAGPAVPPGEGGLPAGSERERCDRYARSADLHHQENLKLNCGYAGERWQVNYDGHFNWCLRVDRALAESETRTREEELGRCRGAAQGIRERCDQYARSADLQHQENLKLNCGYAGERWQVNYDSHFNWCLRVDRALADSENRTREEELGQCRRKAVPGGGAAGTVPGQGALLTYIGCFRDQGQASGTDGRDLDGCYVMQEDLTLQRCVALCKERGFAYAGAQYGAHCFCGNAYGRSGPADNCNVRCGGDSAQICGGAWANSVYATGAGIR